MISKPIVSFGVLYLPHDFSISVYCPRQNKVFHIDLSVLIQEKHRGITNQNPAEYDEIARKTFLYCKNHLDLGDDYDALIFKQPIDGSVDEDTKDRLRFPITYFIKYFKPERVVDYISEPSHNFLHSFYSFHTSGLTDAMCLSWDMGGDLSNFSTHGFKNKTLTYSEDYPFQASSTYVWVGSIVLPFDTALFEKRERGTFRNYCLDLPGKVMGYSGYYKIKYPEYDKEKYAEFVNKTKAAMTSDQLHEDYLVELFNIPHRDGDWRQGFMRDKSSEYSSKSEHDRMFHSAAIQEAYEEFIIDFFYKDEFYKVIKTDYGNNLCMSGGSSLNVLANERIRKEFGFNVFVPPNPGDGGLSEGLLYYYMKSLGVESLRLGSRTNCPLIDENKIPAPKKILNREEFCSLLKEGKIIGFLQGDVENGPRALGRRSILCDPSYPDMKDKINDKVKHREWFRPFAPVCKLEDAHIYFDRDRFDDLEFMSFAVNVKDEYKEQLSSITHVDGTARLQTVTEEQNPVLYGILNTFGGVLLNTSFNVSGKPILNTFESAMTVLNETELDCVVWCDGENYNLYEKNVDL